MPTLKYYLAVSAYKSKEFSHWKTAQRVIAVIPFPEDPIIPGRVFSQMPFPHAFHDLNDRTGTASLGDGIWLLPARWLPILCIYSYTLFGDIMIFHNYVH